MSEGKHIVLHHENFDVSLRNTFKKLQQAPDFYDVSMGCTDSNGKSLQAHKVIVASFSSVFKEMINRATSLNSYINPSMYFRGISHQDLSSILDFIYQGEVCIPEEHMASFLSAAEDLKVEGIENIRISVKNGSKDQAEPSWDTSVSSDLSEHNMLPVHDESILQKEPASTLNPNDMETSFAKDQELFSDVKKTKEDNYSSQQDTSILKPDFASIKISPKPSIVWKHFDSVHKDVVECRLCTKRFVYNGRSTGTSTILKHLKKIHSNVFKQTSDVVVKETPRTTLQKRSIVWKHFDTNHKDEVECKLCTKKFAYNIHNGTSTILKHLQNTHGNVLKQASGNVVEKKPDIVADEKDNIVPLNRSELDNFYDELIR